MVDLHIHTTASDGTCSPIEILEIAMEKGITTIAITDHDTMGNVQEAQELSKRYGIEVIPGIEISSDYRGVDTHILGYGVDPHAYCIREMLDWNIREREDRNRRIVELMQKDGLPVSLEMLEKKNPGAVIGRPHMAKFLVEFGLAESVPDAFKTWVGDGCPYYLPRRHMPMRQAIELIKDGKGIPVVAHPLQYRYSQDELEEFLKNAYEWGAEGIECYYSGYSEEETENLRVIADRYQMIPTGGSDFHGTNKPRIMLGSGYGNLCVPDSVVTALRKKLGEKV